MIPYPVFLSRQLIHLLATPYGMRSLYCLSSGLKKGMWRSDLRQNACAMTSGSLKNAKWGVILVVIVKFRILSDFGLHDFQPGCAMLNFMPPMSTTCQGSSILGCHGERGVIAKAHGRVNQIEKEN